MANNKNMKDYLHRMLVPPGFRPQSEEDIEKVLDAFDEGPLDSEIVERVLGKSKGEIQRSYDSVEFDTTGTVQDRAESEELLALHRSEGDVESDDVKKKLEEYRQHAKEQDVDDETENDVD